MSITELPSTAGAEKAQRSLDSHLSTLDSTPLFMTQLPSDNEGQKEDSTILDALQSLTFDGTPDEVASNFKRQGNEYFVAKRYTEARGFYSQGLDAFPTDVKLQETLYVNRAACNLPLENYGMVLKDCSSALGLNPASVKAFFRSAKALSALKRYVEAIDCCDHALLHDKDNVEIVKLRAQILKQKIEEDRKEKETAERERRTNETKTALTKAFLARGLWIESTSKPPENPNPAQFDPDAISGTDSSSTLPLTITNKEGEITANTKWHTPDAIRTPIIFPVVLLYPQYHQSDMVSQFHEDTTLGAHLDMMFPHPPSLPWDTKGEYVSSNLSILATTHSKRILRIGKGLTLREAMDHCARDADPAKKEERDGMVLQDGILSFIVIPKGSEAEKRWIEEFKKQRNVNP